MNLAERFLEQAERRPEAVAIRTAKHAVTFRQLAERSGRGALRLRELGLLPGDRVLVLVPVGIELYETILAVLRAGLVAVFVDPSAGRKHLEQAVDRVSPRALVGTPKALLFRWITPALRRIPLAVSFGAFPGAARWGRPPGSEDASFLESCPSEHPALLTFTSGSTGQPKAAVRTHGFLEAQWRVVAETLGHREGEMDLATLPVFVLANLASGLTTLLPDADLRSPGAITPGPVLAQILAWKPATTAASPAFLERLAQGAEQAGGGLESFRAIFTGGAPVLPSLLERLQRLAPAAAVVAVYGSTEAEPIAEIPFSEVSADDLVRMQQGQGLLVGRPVAAVGLRILPDRLGEPLGPLDLDAFEAMLLPPGSPGEILVAGAHVLSGYLDGQGDAETKVRVGDAVWHRTGDLGRLDADGRLWLLGRCAAVVRDEAGVLFPFAVEVAAQQLPGIRRAALVAGRRILAVEGSAEPELVRTQLAWAGLERVVTLPRIPLDRRHNAKVDYQSLTALVARAIGSRK